jgi:hypothetical protein
MRPLSIRKIARVLGYTSHMLNTYINKRGLHQGVEV